MSERKLTISAIRTLYGLTIVQISRASAVGERIVYMACVQIPISREDALKICEGLTSLTQKLWTLDTVDMVLLEDFFILWIIRASHSPDRSRNDSPADEYHFVYARSWDHARFLVKDWLEHLPYLPYHSFTPYPAGFMVGNINVPGYLDTPNTIEDVCKESL